MFQQILDQADDIPDYEICLAYGFREKHDYRNKNEINTMKIGEHIGILLLFKLPNEVKEMIEDNESLQHCLGFYDETGRTLTKSVHVLWCNG